MLLKYPDTSIIQIIEVYIMKVHLDRIIHNKKQELKEKKKTRDFLEAVKNTKAGDISIIAEIKLGSPSAGRLGREAMLAEKVKEYASGGADAISVVVDKKYFGGNLEFIRRIKNAVSLPVLAKDFIIDPFQIYELKYYGADAVLLIAKILTLDKLVQLVKLTKELNLEPVVEVHNKGELNQAIQTDTRIIAVNARDLATFEVDIRKACKLIKTIPEKFAALGFSGVSNRDDVEKYKTAGAKGILVGTSLMKAQNTGIFLKELNE